MTQNLSAIGKNCYLGKKKKYMAHLSVKAGWTLLRATTYHFISNTIVFTIDQLEDQKLTFCKTINNVTAQQRQQPCLALATSLPL